MKPSKPKPRRKPKLTLAQLEKRVAELEEAVATIAPASLFAYAHRKKARTHRSMIIG